MRAASSSQWFRRHVQNIFTDIRVIQPDHCTWRSQIGATELNGAIKRLKMNKASDECGWWLNCCNLRRTMLWQLSRASWTKFCIQGKYHRLENGEQWLPTTENARTTRTSGPLLILDSGTKRLHTWSWGNRGAVGTTWRTAFLQNEPEDWGETVVDSYFRFVEIFWPCGLGCFMARFATTWGVSSSYLVVASRGFQPDWTNQWTLGWEPWVLHRGWRATMMCIRPPFILSVLAVWCFKKWVGLRRRWATFIGSSLCKRNFVVWGICRTTWLYAW